MKKSRTKTSHTINPFPGHQSPRALTTPASLGTIKFKQPIDGRRRSLEIKKPLFPIVDYLACDGTIIAIEIHCFVHETSTLSKHHTFFQCFYHTGKIVSFSSLGWVEGWFFFIFRVWRGMKNVAKWVKTLGRFHSSLHVHCCILETCSLLLLYVCVVNYWILFFFLVYVIFCLEKYRNFSHESVFSIRKFEV